MTTSPSFLSLKFMQSPSEKKKKKEDMKMLDSQQSVSPETKVDPHVHLSPASSFCSQFDFLTDPFE